MFDDPDDELPLVGDTGFAPPEPLFAELPEVEAPDAGLTDPDDDDEFDESDEPDEPDESDDEPPEELDFSDGCAARESVR